HKLGVPLRDLLAANRDIHPARLMVGDVLCIPREEDDSAQIPSDDMTTGTDQPPVNTGGTTPAPACPVEDQYIVQRGQTVADIQLRALLSRHTLDAANPDVNLESLRVGQTICVPKENTACEVPSTYTLDKTENLEAVAVQFSLPIASILRANPCLAPQDFVPGTTVIIPTA
ncbi:MAG: LysM peptidoglycan-binding domain-containing protein, partial [Eubacteriales bacterium]|nr:LysM peptidoglycan-binding domain-containing protein [Eubacteriales bacterium]